jgi:hypothetical protein
MENKKILSTASKKIQRTASILGWRRNMVVFAHLITSIRIGSFTQQELAELLVTMLGSMQQLSCQITRHGQCAFADFPTHVDILLMQPSHIL